MPPSLARAARSKSKGTLVSAIRAFQRGIDAIGGRFELRHQIVQRGPRFGDIRSPFSLESFELGVGRGVTGEIFFDEARDGSQRGSVVRQIQFKTVRNLRRLGHIREMFH